MLPRTFVNHAQILAFINACPHSFEVRAITNGYAEQASGFVVMHKIKARCPLSSTYSTALTSIAEGDEEEADIDSDDEFGEFQVAPPIEACGDDDSPTTLSSLTCDSPPDERVREETWKPNPVTVMGTKTARYISLNDVSKAVAAAEFTRIMTLDGLTDTLNADEINAIICAKILTGENETLADPQLLSLHKEHYNSLLAANFARFTDSQRVALAHYLLEPNNKHFLTQEGHYSKWTSCFFRAERSSETRSMHTAIKCLLRDSSTQLIVERSCFTDKLTITAQDTAQDQTPIVLSRFGH